ncbi:radical SAM protein [Desulfovibrio sp. OttesenSCG-928-M16]|nr:radical SAM protein [Desulfovibrio sp. OttesenSCG-928-M16]
MAASAIRPCLVLADAQGNIYDDPELLMVCRHGAQFALPRPDELMPLPRESELFLLPGRKALGLDAESGQLLEGDGLAVAAFAAPAHTLTAHPAYATEPNAPMLPLFAYGAVGFAKGRFYVCAKKVDDDQRQVFQGISPALVKKKALALMKRFPENRLIQHLAGQCALVYACPAARNFCLGRYEAPLPVSRSCNARCIGCISQQGEDSPVCATPQKRMGFTPTAEEIVEVMEVHAANESAAPIFSFGQGCEGEPLTKADLLTEAVSLYRSRRGVGSINLNSNASMPKAVARLAEAGLSSLRVSLNSARPEVYERYYRPLDYDFEKVRQSIALAKKAGLFVSLNLLYFPGFSDTEEECEALSRLVGEHAVDMIQLRNLNIDPEYYLELMQDVESGPLLGFHNFRKRLKKDNPHLRFGYFNPFVAQRLLSDDN